MFDTKIERFNLTAHIDKFDTEGDFDKIDNYKSIINSFIFTEIKMTDHTESIEKAFQSRLQILISAVLLRSLYLKEGIVIALNDNNFPSYYSILKSFFEVLAILGYTAHLIYSNNDYNLITEKLVQLYMGNRKAGAHPVGNIEQVSIITMFQKADEILIGKENKEKHNLSFEHAYGYICNFQHINYNAHLSTGKLDNEAIWIPKENQLSYKTGLYAFYMPEFIQSIDAIEFLCKLIIRNDKVKNFNLINNKYYFQR